MTSLLIKPRNKKELVTFKKILKLLDADFETQETPYNPEFVNRILEKSKKGNFTTIDTTDVWGSLGFK